MEHREAGASATTHATGFRATVTGATGFVGRRLVEALPTPTVLGRDPGRARDVLGGAVEARAWDPGAGLAPVDALRGRDAVFHLAGEPVAEGSWTPARRARIRDSRVLGTRHLVQALAALPPGERPRVLVSASAVGLYGSRGDEELTEAAAPGADFLADVCRAWEQEALAAEALGVRAVCLRIGIVLGAGGGALARLWPLFSFGLGGRLTYSGRQWVPWVHLDDVVGLALHAARDEGLRGPVNATAPTPVRNHEFTRALARAARRPAPFAVPEFALRLVMGDLAQVMTASQRCVPAAALARGYRFLHPTIDGALAAVARARQEPHAWPVTA